MESKPNETMTIDVNAPELKISEEYLYSLTKNGLIQNIIAKEQKFFDGGSRIGKSISGYEKRRIGGWYPTQKIRSIGSWFSPSKQEKMRGQMYSNFARCCTCNEYTKNCMCEERNNKYRRFERCYICNKFVADCHGCI